jgi:apolipoprotein N-acyltransferase
LKPSDLEQQVAARRTTRTALLLSVAAGLLLWASFPPLNLWPLAWVAPVPWLLLARLPQRLTWRTYGAIYFGGLVHWLAMVQGIRLAHPLLIGGWIALAWYLAFYTPALVWLCRVAIHRWKVPLVVVAPVVWTGLELVRGHALTGFSGGLLAHTQVAWTSLIQVADLCGAYAVSFVMALSAAAIAQMLPLDWIGGKRQVHRWTVWPIVPAALVLAAALAYGFYRLGETPPDADQTPLRVALIQGSLDTVFDASEEAYYERVDRTLRHYSRLTTKAVAESDRLDLVIWPESMVPKVERRISQPLQVPEDIEISPELLQERLIEAQEDFEQFIREAADAMNPGRSTNRGEGGGTYFLFGTTTLEYGPHEPRHYNSALLADPEGRIVGRYYKMHLVMFGEYIPFGAWFPLLYDLTPLGGGLDAGDRPASLEVAGKRLSPCVCFENFVPHLVRRQVLELTEQGSPPDILVTVTNDGWFYGTSILDLHLRCAVFRAVENRRPMLIAANTGFSAHIDGSGRLLAVGPRRAPQVLLAEATLDGRTPIYHRIGDWPAIACAAVGGILGAIGLTAAVRRRPVS